MAKNVKFYTCGYPCDRYQQQQQPQEDELLVSKLARNLTGSGIRRTSLGTPRKKKKLT